MELSGIDNAIKHAGHAVTLLPNEHPELPYWLAKLGGSHAKRFWHLGEQDDITKAIECTSRALTLAPNDHPHLRYWLGSLGLFHDSRFQHLGELDDMEKSIEYMSRALALAPDGDPYLPYLLHNLGLAYSNRFQRLGELDDMEKSLYYTSRAVSLTPNDHPDLPNRLTGLGVSHNGRFQRLGGLDDTEKAVEYSSRALALTPNDHPNLPHQLTHLGVSLINRFKRLGKLGDVQKSIEFSSHALALTPESHPDLPHRLVCLGMSYREQFQRLGDPDDLERAIEYASHALVLTPDGHPDLASRLASLGTSHNDRFRHLGELGDLEKAIEYASRALALTPDGHPDLASRLASLGTSHNEQFRHLGELGDLEKAIEYASRALALTPDGHPDLASRLASLGMSHNEQFRHLGELGNLEKAIEYASRALALTPDGHPDLPHRLTILGVSLNDRFQCLGDLSDIEKSIEYIFRALSLTPDGHPSSSGRHFHLAKTFFLQYQHTSDSTCLQDSLDYFRKASRVLAGAPREKFTYAFHWAKLASENSCLNCIEAYQTTIDLLPWFIRLGATTNQRYQDLEQVQNLAICAAAAAILASDHELALEWLEHARCVIWNQSLMLRSPLDRLHSAHPTLATRLQTVADQLHHAGSESRESQALSSGSLTPEQVAQKHRRLAKEYEDLLSHTRTLPGFEDFLKPIKANLLVRAARIGPVVVINCHKNRCDALVILPEQGTIDHIPLPNFTGEKAQRIRLEMEGGIPQPRERGVTRRPLSEQGGDSASDFERVLKALWYDIVRPVLEFLGCMNQTPVEDLPHITWCPTGALTFLPLHAAGDYDQPGSRVFDYVISSYTPTVTALLPSTTSSLNRNSRVLAIGQPNTPGHSRLPGTTRELAYVEAHVRGRVEYSQLVGDQATTTAVLDAMEHHDWVHFACHSHQNVKDPTRSGFFLHNDSLDLASITRRSFKNKGLAYLSSCETATGDKKLPDEAVHLASAMLMAGYTSVIGTMWAVMDEDAPLVADKVYAELMKEGKVGNGEAGKALHYAIAELRDKVGERAFERWVPFIHMGS